MYVYSGCLIEQLTEEKYECMVCCEVIRVMAPVWSCQSCFHVFHLNCIKKWARSPASQADGIASTHRTVFCSYDQLFECSIPDRNRQVVKCVRFTETGEGWRCPACQNVALKFPTSYICFCGKKKLLIIVFMISLFKQLL